jgi:hypothetical protein
MGKMWNITLSGRHHLKELGRDGKLELEGLGCGLYSSGSGYKPLLGFCKPMQFKACNSLTSPLSRVLIVLRQ